MVCVGGGGTYIQERKNEYIVGKNGVECENTSGGFNERGRARQTMVEQIIVLH